MKIQTAFGEKNVDQKLIGAGCDYYHELPGPSAPHGAWWKHTDRHGFVPVHSNSRELLAIIDANLRGSRNVTVLD